MYVGGALRLIPTTGRQEAAGSPRHGWQRGLAAVVLAMLLVSAPNASAVEQVINSSGPLTQISLGDDLACQVLHVDDAQPAFFAGNNFPGSCGTFIHVGGTLYGPPTAPAVISPVAHTPVSQTPVSGAGSFTDPFRVTTVVDAGTTGLRISRTDSYVTGLEAYGSDLTVSNSSGVQQTAALYQAGDCVLSGSDAGFGFFRALDGGIFCAVNANNTPPGRILGFIPVSADSHYLESGAATTPDVWVAMDGSNYPDVCHCTILQDNGAGLSWVITVPPGGSVTRTLATALEAPLPPPVIGTSVNAAPLSGTVLVALPAGASDARVGGGSAQASPKGLTFVPLSEDRHIPVGSFLDARRGSVRVLSAQNRSGKTQSGKFSSGLFQVLQSRRRSARGLTELRLTGSSFKGCGSGRQSRLGESQAARRRLSRRTVRRLRANAKGRFSTRGRESAATVRGTQWDTFDRCDGTLTRVRRGRVVVRDFRRRRNIVLRAGQDYLAPARR